MWLWSALVGSLVSYHERTPGNKRAGEHFDDIKCHYSGPAVAPIDDDGPDDADDESWSRV